MVSGLTTIGLGVRTTGGGSTAALAFNQSCTFCDLGVTEGGIFADEGWLRRFSIEKGGGVVSGLTTIGLGARTTGGGGGSTAALAFNQSCTFCDLGVTEGGIFADEGWLVDCDVVIA